MRPLPSPLPPPPKKALARHLPPAKRLNRLETSYASHLNLLKMAGEIEDYRVHGVTLKLADDTRYTPDFLVIGKEGQVELQETKGWMRDDANVKLKVAAAQFPWFVFKLVTWKDKNWQVRIIL